MLSCLFCCLLEKLSSLRWVKLNGSTLQLYSGLLIITACAHIRSFPKTQSLLSTNRSIESTKKQTNHKHIMGHVALIIITSLFGLNNLWIASSASGRLGIPQQYPPRAHNTGNRHRQWEHREEQRMKRLDNFKQQIKDLECAEIMSLIQNDGEWMRLPSIQLYSVILSKCQIAEDQEAIIASLMQNGVKRTWNGPSNKYAFLTLKTAIFGGEMEEARQDLLWLDIIKKMGTLITCTELKNRLVRIVEHHMDSDQQREQTLAIKMMQIWYDSIDKENWTDLDEFDEKMEFFFWNCIASSQRSSANNIIQIMQRIGEDISNYQDVSHAMFDEPDDLNVYLDAIGTNHQFVEKNNSTFMLPDNKNYLAGISKNQYKR